MTVHRLATACAAMLLFVTSGCGFVTKSRLTASESMNRSLTEQCRAQVAEIENYKQHCRDLEQQLEHTEQDLALLERESGLDRGHLADYRRDRAELEQRIARLRRGQSALPPDLSGRLVELSKRHPGLEFDPQTGISKFDTDVLFQSAECDLEPGSEKLLHEFARIFESPQARDLRIMIVGHTDDRGIAKKPTRERFPNNWHLSTARALAVADYLREQGFPEQRMGVAGFGEQQPIAGNGNDGERRRNRRVEIFVMGPETPVVGWVDSIPSVY